MDIEPAPAPVAAARILHARASRNRLSSLFSLGCEPAPIYSSAALRLMRKAQFAESPAQRAMRVAGAIRGALARDGVRGCLASLDVIARDKAIAADGLPDPDGALTKPDGLCGAVSDLSLDTLMAAFGRGLYPAAHMGPLRWWAPQTRALARISEILGRPADGGPIALSFDVNFEHALVADPNEPALSPPLKWAYATLYDAGFAHCFEAYGRDGTPVAHGFGVAVGDVFTLGGLVIRDERHAQAFFQTLARRLAALGYEILDARRPSARTHMFGFTPTPRAVYNARLLLGLANERIGKWTTTTRPAIPATRLAHDRAA